MLTVHTCTPQCGVQQIQVSPVLRPHPKLVSCRFFNLGKSQGVEQLSALHTHVDVRYAHVNNHERLMLDSQLAQVLLHGVQDRFCMLYSE